MCYCIWKHPAWCHLSWSTPCLTGTHPESYGPEPWRLLQLSSLWALLLQCKWEKFYIKNNQFELILLNLVSSIMNCGQHQWAIPSPLSIALQALLEENTTRKLLSLSLDLFFKILVFQVTFLIFFSIAICSLSFLLVGLLLQPVALFQSREVVKYLESL